MKFEKLKNIIEIRKGKKPSIVKTRDANSTRVLQIDDLRNDENIKFTNDKNGVYAKEDDVLIAWDGANAGTIGYGKSGYIGSTIALLRKKQPNLYSTTFIGIFLQSQYQYLRNTATGATIPHISRKALDDLEIPVLGITDQIKIANLLSKARYLIAQRKQSISLLDEFLKSTFLEMFGDPVRNEKAWKMIAGDEYLSKLTVGVVIKPASYYVSEGVIALRSLNIRPNRIQLDSLVYFSKTVNENELSKSILREGDVVFVRTGVTGTAAIVPKELDGSNCIDLIITRPKVGVINPQYLVFFFNSDIGKRIVLAKEVGGIQKHFNIGALRKLKIPVPPFSLQIQFAQIVEKTEALKSYYQQSLQELENLYDGLSQKTFSRK